MLNLTPESASRVASAPDQYRSLVGGSEARFAVVRGALAVRNVEAYLPDNYVLCESWEEERHVGWGGTSQPIIRKEIVVVIGGTDNAGWTLDDYVIPRLASGLLWATEIV